MKILILCSKNSGHIAPFITDQADALSAEGVQIEIFTIVGKGLKGYLKNLDLLKKKIKEFQPNLIHAHYGLSGLLANLQRSIPVITTYHGSDINNPKVFLFSKVSILLSAWNIFVSQKNIDRAGVKQNFSLIPCGVDLNLFKPMDKQEARKNLRLDKDEKLVLFAGAFDNRVKNPELAIQAIEKVPEARLLELKGYTRSEVVLLMNAVDVCLMTSYTEGSPQFVKEALACNCPIVSVNVGDVEELLHGVENCKIVERNAGHIAESLNEILVLSPRTNGSRKIVDARLDSKSVSLALLHIYQKFIK